MTGAGAKIEHGSRRDFQLVEPRDELVAHALLQRRRGVVAVAGAVEGTRHGAAIQREDLPRIARAHARNASARAATSASTWASSCAADSVTRSRAVPCGTVGGLMAVT